MRSRMMIYFMAAATAGMLGYMLWLTAFRMRRDRIAAERELTRGKFTFRPRDKLRFLLKRAFAVSKDKAEWEAPLVSRLSEASREDGPNPQPLPREEPDSIDRRDR